MWICTTQECTIWSSMLSVSTNSLRQFRLPIPSLSTTRVVTSIFAWAYYSVIQYTVSKPTAYHLPNKPDREESNLCHSAFSQNNSCAPSLFLHFRLRGSSAIKLLSDTVSSQHPLTD